MATSLRYPRPFRQTSANLSEHELGDLYAFFRLRHFGIVRITGVTQSMLSVQVRALRETYRAFRVGSGRRNTKLETEDLNLICFDFSG